MARRRAKRTKKTESNQKKGCTRRDILLGFWMGLAGAAIYVNFKRKPVIQSVEERRENSATTAAPAASQASGLSSADVVAIPVDSAPASATAVSLSSIVGNSWVDGVTRPTQRDFQEIGRRTGTDKVWGADKWDACEKDNAACPSPDMVNPKCKTLQGHWYHTFYNRWLGPYSTDDAEPFQFLEIGHFTGKGFDAYKEFIPKAETHSIEIACLPPGKFEEGKWPFGNFPAENPKYQEYLETNQLHCGDASKWETLNEIWTTKMKRADAPPLKVVVDDAAHVASHMATTLTFWFPKIEPGGILVVEDIQPIPEANKFRTDVLPQVLKDLHYCGDPNFQDKTCFPTIMPLLHSVHCETHICVFERNEMPSVEYGMAESMPPPNALDGAECLLRSTPV